MPIRADRASRELAGLLLDGRPPGVSWFDAHTHMGHADPDGAKATPQEILDGLDVAGHDRALLFAMHEPEGYGPANDAVLAACAASGGRLVALCRVDPSAPGALEEARRCLGLGAVGVKLHPRSDAFGLPHPVVERLVALVAAERRCVLFHAGRGIPNLGAAAAALARAHPAARIILAHAGISDLGQLGAAAAELDNLLFDTSWWNLPDLLALVTSVPPGRVLYASDMPYGPGVTAAFLLRRAVAQAGWSAEQTAVAAGGQLARVVDGAPLLDLGPALGTEALGPRVPGLERVVGHTASALQVLFRGGDPTEPAALARLGCQHGETDPHGELLDLADALLSRALQRRGPTGSGDLDMIPALLAAHALCATPAAGVPAGGV